MRKHVADVEQEAVALRAVPSIWEAITQQDRELVAEALSALLAERSRAFRIAHDSAVAHRRPLPTVDDFELSCILRLQRAVADSNGTDRGTTPCV